MSRSKYKKEGSVLLVTLLFIMLTVVLVAIMFSHMTAVEGSLKAKKAAQLVAESRATAIDVPLKEEFGYVEIFHKTEEEGYVKRSKFPVEPNYGVLTPGYGQKILSPSDPKYKESVKKADAAAKKVAMSHLDKMTTGEEESTKLLDIDEDDICIEVISLPKDKIKNMGIKCGESPVIEVPVYGMDHILNKDDGEQGEIQNKIQNYNFVLATITYEEKSFFYKAIQRFAHGSDEKKWTKPPTKTVWAIAYPQIDRCAGGDCNQ